MIGNDVTLLDTLFIAVSSMLLVFSVLMILYVLLKLFPTVFRQNERKILETQLPDPAADEEEEIAAVVAAAIAAFKTGPKLPNRMARSGRRYPGVKNLAPEGSLARDCNYVERKVI